MEEPMKRNIELKMCVNRKAAKYYLDYQIVENMENKMARLFFDKYTDEPIGLIIGKKENVNRIESSEEKGGQIIDDYETLENIVKDRIGESGVEVYNYKDKGFRNEVIQQIMFCALKQKSKMTVVKSEREETRLDVKTDKKEKEKDDSETSERSNITDEDSIQFLSQVEILAFLEANLPDEKTLNFRPYYNREKIKSKAEELLVFEHIKDDEGAFAMNGFSGQMEIIKKEETYEKQLKEIKEQIEKKIGDRSTGLKYDEIYDKIPKNDCMFLVCLGHGSVIIKTQDDELYSFDSLGTHHRQDRNNNVVFNAVELGDLSDSTSGKSSDKTVSSSSSQSATISEKKFGLPLQQEASERATKTIKKSENKKKT